MKIKIYKLDAFTNERFKGNPAAVCMLDEWISDDLMQNIAAENNLAETAFLVKSKDFYEIRWFTPKVEVDLCGHATLASAFVLFNIYNISGDVVVFKSHLSGELKVAKEADGTLILDFPKDKIEACKLPECLKNGFSSMPIECFKGKTDYLLIFESQKQLETIDTDFTQISKADCRGVIISAPGKDVDFVSRFFAPQSGIDEDPVTGSAHTTLTPYWAKRLGKLKLSAKQLSSRKGNLVCTDQGDRVLIGGSVVLYLEGNIVV